MGTLYEVRVSLFAKYWLIIRISHQQIPPPYPLPGQASPPCHIDAAMTHGNTSGLSRLPKVPMKTLQATAFLSLLIALAACTSSAPAPRLPEGARTGVPAPRVDLSVYHPPGNLLNFNLLGDVSGGSSQTRLFRYQGAEASQTLDFSLYPQPGGWELMGEERRVAGHYLPVRQALLEKLLQQGASEVSSDNESLSVTADGHYIARGRLVANGTRPRQQWLLLTTHDQLFVRATLTAPGDLPAVATRNTIDLALQQFLQALASGSGNNGAQQPGQQQE